jgi:hypothetical protein
MTQRRDFWSYVTGDSLLFQYVITDDAGDPLDLTGATLRWGLAAVENGLPGTVVVEKVLDDGISILGAAENGEIEVVVDPGEIATPGVYWHELEVLTQYGAKVTVSHGILNAEPVIYAD